VAAHPRRKNKDAPRVGHPECWLGSDARWRRWWGVVAAGAGALAMLHSFLAFLLQGGEFGFLIVVQECCDFGVGVIADGFHLPASWGWGRGSSVGAGSAAAQGLHLLRAFGEQGFYLRLLVGGEVEAVGEHLQLAFRVAAAGAHLAGGRCCIVLGPDGGAGDGKNAGQQKSAFGEGITGY